MNKKNIYMDPSLLADKEDGVKIKKDDTPRQKTLKDIWKEFCDQLLSPRNLITFMILVFIFYSVVIYKEVIDVPTTIKYIPYFLLIGAVLASIQAGKPNWSKITIWITIGVVAVFVYGTFNKFEKTRSGDKKEIGQKIYNGLADYFTEKEAEAKIPPRTPQERIAPFKDFNLTKTEKFIGIINPGERFQYISPVWFYLKTETGKKVPYMPSQNPGEIRYIQSDFGRIPPCGYRLYISSKDQAAIIKYRFK